MKSAAKLRIAHKKGRFVVRDADPHVGGSALEAARLEFGDGVSATATTDASGVQLHASPANGAPEVRVREARGGVARVTAPTGSPSGGAFEMGL